MLSGDVKRHIADMMGAAAHGERTALAKRLAVVYGVSVATIYRYAKRNGAKRKRQPVNPEYRTWTRAAVAIAHSVPGGKPLPLELAIEAGIQSGRLPPEAAAMPVATARRLARGELGLAVKPKRTHRLVADYPMQAIQIDGSTSEYLVVERALPDGDYLLKLHRRPYPAAGYKNKPLGPEKLRVLVYAVWDMCTGYTLSRYCVARGENALDSMDSLCWALAVKDDPRIPFHGVPDDLWTDQGPLFKSGPACDLIERLNINLVTGAPYAKERMGGVERTHRTRWQSFERALFLRTEQTITLSALNRRLAEFEIRQNNVRPSRTPVDGVPVSRADAWVALTNRRPANSRLRKLPDNPIETMAREARRYVDQNGVVRWCGRQYELERMHSAWVIARRPMDADAPEAMICECEQSGERHIATLLTPRSYGEIIGSPKTELDKLIDDSSPASADLYAASKAGRIPRLPAATAEAGSFNNPLDASRYADLAQALEAFQNIYLYPLRDDNRALVIERLEACGYDKAAVRDLALELAAPSTPVNTRA